MTRTQRLLTILLLAGACLTPLIIRVMFVPVAGGFAALGYPPVVIDGFSWAKGVFVVLIAVLGFCVTMRGLMNRDTVVTPLDRVLLAAAGLAVMSSMLTPYKALGQVGVPYMFDGLWTFLAYLGLTFTASRAGTTLIYWLPWGLGLTVSVVAAIAIPEAHGVNVFGKSTILTQLLSPGPGLTVHYDGKFAAAAAPFGNPNYLGAFAAMTWPLLSLSVFTSVTDRARSYFAITGALALALLLASGTRSAMIGGGAAVLVACVMMFSFRNAYDRRQVGYLVISAAAGFSLFYFTARGNPLRRLESISQSFVLEESLALDAADRESTDDSITQLRGRLRVASQGAAIFIERFPDTVKFMTEDYRPIFYRADGDKIFLLDDAYRSWSVAKVELGGFSGFDINGMTVIVTPHGFRVLRGSMLIKPIAGESIAIPLADAALSRRGFIWSRTLPLLKDKWLLGSGPAAFPFEFPNADVGAKIKNLGFRTLVDKPHNLYLSWAFSYGIVTAVLLISLIVVVWGRLFRRILFRGVDSVTAVPYLAAVVGFVIASTCTDSTVGVSAPFWVIFGCCIYLGWPKLICTQSEGQRARPAS